MNTSRHRKSTRLSTLLIAGVAIPAAFAAEPTYTLSESQLEALIDRRIDARLEALGIVGNDMDGRIAEGIRAFVAEQRARNEPSAKARNVRRVDREADHIRGNPRAPVSLIEYSDFECPFCKRFHATAQRLIEQHADKVNWVYRHFPLAFHNPGAQKQAEASECAAELGGNEAFWRYTDLIYERTASNGNGFPIDDLLPLAAEIGLDADAFGECLQAERFTERVREDYADGARAGVTGTPGNILLDNATGAAVAVMGAQPYASLEAALESLLAERN